MFDPVERDFNAFSKSQSYAEDFEEAVNERVQQEVDKFFDDLVVNDVDVYLGGDNSIVLELNGNGFVLTPEAFGQTVTTTLKILVGCERRSGTRALLHGREAQPLHTPTREPLSRVCPQQLKLMHRNWCLELRCASFRV